MTRDLTRLAEGTSDLLVVGGGVLGLAVAYDAAQRGLTVALVERGDFGGGLSFNHQRTVHGGLRSLQSADLRRARESIRERRALARMAPHLLRPLPFLMPVYRSVRRGRLALRLAFQLDAWLARDRNRNVVPELHLPAGRLVSRAACERLFHGVNTGGLTGGASWYDYQMIEPHRLTLAFAIAAAQHGAALANRVEARAPILERGAVAGMRVHDLLSGTDFDVRAQLTLNAAGAGAGRVMTSLGVARPLPLIKTMNLVTNRPVSELALAAPGPDGRILTLVPWHGCALVGTSQAEQAAGPDEAGVSAADVEAFRQAANAAFPALDLGPDQVTFVHQGFVPAVTGRDGRADLKSVAEIFDHAADGVRGAVTVIAVKYTTARGVAKRAVDLVFRKLGRTRVTCRTQQVPLPGAGIADVEAIAIEAARAGRAELDADVLANLTRLYGARCPGVIRLALDRPDLAARLAPGCPVLKAEIVHAVREEMASSLTDVVLRRTALGHLAHPGSDIAAVCARLMAEELGWSDEEVSRQLADLEAAFLVPGAARNEAHG